MNTVDLLTPTSSPSDVAATAPEAVAPSGALTALPHAAGRSGHLLPLPKETRGGDVKNAPYAPLRAVEHLLNQQPIFVSEPSCDGGEAA